MRPGETPRQTGASEVKAKSPCLPGACPSLAQSRASVETSFLPPLFSPVSERGAAVRDRTVRGTGLGAAGNRVARTPGWTCCGHPGAGAEGRGVWGRWPIERTRSRGLDDTSKECRQPRGATGTHQPLRPSTWAARRSRQGGLRSHVEEGRVKTLQLERMGVCTGDPRRRGRATLGGEAFQGKRGRGCKGNTPLKGPLGKGSGGMG